MMEYAEDNDRRYNEREPLDGPQIFPSGRSKNYSVTKKWHVFYCKARGDPKT